MNLKNLVSACCIAASLFLTPASVDACPTCKDALADNDPAQQQLVKGYSYSIMFMMSMPFLIVGTFGSMAYLSIRRARRAEKTLEEGDAQPDWP